MVDKIARNAIKLLVERLQDQNEDLMQLMEDIQAWEQDLEKTKNEKGVPQINQKLWKQWQKLQAERNRIFSFYK